MSRNLKWLSDEEYKFIYSRVPRLCVDLLIVDDNSFVLIKRSNQPFKGLWHFPGGRVFYKEPINNALSRIAKDELSIRIKDTKFLGFFEMLEDGEFVHTVSIVFTAQIDYGKMKVGKLRKEIRRFTRIPQNIHPFHKQFMKDYWNLISSMLQKTKAA